MSCTRKRKRNPEGVWTENTLRCMAVVKQANPAQQERFKRLCSGIGPENQQVLVDAYLNREGHLVLTLQWHPLAAEKRIYIGPRGGLS